MSYENAPATKLLAQQCAVCRRPLVDAISVELGIGPDCREKHGFNIEVDPDARTEANKLVHAIALGCDAETLKLHVLALRCYGFEKLASVIVDRTAKVKISDAPGGLISVDTPYDPGFVQSFKLALPWRRWDAENKVWLIPATQDSKNALYAVLRRYFSGALGVSPRGMFVVQGA